MIEKYKNEFDQVKENLNVLPHSKKGEIEKYNQYISDNYDKYNQIFDSIKSVIKTRYNNILNITSNNNYDCMNEAKMNYSLLKQFNPYATSMSKMGLDVNIYRLKQFYKNDLKVVNKIILDIVASFTKCGVKLTANDFNYTIYVSEYMRVLLENNSDDEKIFKAFEDIYWKCPDVINQISLNFYKLYYLHEKEINKYFMSNNINKDDCIRDYNILIEKRNNIVHNDKLYIYNMFFNQTIFTKDYSNSNVDRLKSTYVADIDNQNNYNNITKLYVNLSFYKKYMNYQNLINNIKELYKEKDSYKGLFVNKRKEILKKESELEKLNKKYLSKGFLSPNDKKKAEILLKIQSIYLELMTLYNELDELTIKDKINLYISDDSKIPELLSLASSDFKYIYSLCKEEKKDSTIDDAIEFQQSLDELIFANDLDIIKNINIIDEKNVAQIVVDHYKLLNINLDEEKISESGIDLVLSELKLLLTAYDIERLEINISDIDYVMNVRKLDIK